MASSEKERLFSGSTNSTTCSSTHRKYGAEFELVSSASLSTVNEPPPQTVKQRIRKSVWFPISFIFAFMFFITMVEHGVRFNVVLYTERVLKYTKGNSPILIAAFDAIAPCLPLIGGWLGDSWFTRSKVMATGALATLTGILLLTINVAPYSDDAEENFSMTAKRALFVIGFTMIFVGLALYDANDYVIAAREIEKERGPNHNHNRIRKMFCVFYIVYFSAVTSSEVLFRLVDATSFFFVYLLLAASVVLSISAVLLGQRFYVEEQRKRYMLRNQFRIIWEGISRRKKAPDVPKWIDRASIQYGGTFPPEEVYETKHLLRTLPIFHTVTIFVIVNYFIDYTYPEQTRLLNPALDSDITAAEFIYKLYQPIMSVVTNLVVLSVLYPCTSRWGRCVSPFVRISAGIMFGILSVVFAAIVETGRKNMMAEEDGIVVVMVNNITHNASSLSVTAQIPQYTCAGIGEALVLTAGVEVSYVEAAYNMKGFTVGLFLLMSGVGSYILAQLIIVIVNGISGAAGQEWYTDDLNTARLEYFYCILAAILILDILYVYLVTRKYERAEESLKTKARANHPIENKDDVGDDDNDDKKENEHGDDHAEEISDMSER